MSFLKNLTYVIACVSILLTGMKSFVSNAMADNKVDVAIVFLLDRSPSMNSDEIKLARDSHAHALVSTDVLRAIVQGHYGRIAVSFAEFDTFSRRILDWQIIDGPTSAERVSGLIYDYAKDYKNNVGGGDTNLTAGFEEAEKLIDLLPYEADRLVVDVVGDGAQNSALTMYPIATWRKRLLDKGATINGMPLLHDPTGKPADVLEFYKTQVMGGPSAFVLPLTDINLLPVLLRQKIVQELY